MFNIYEMTVVWMWIIKKTLTLVRQNNLNNPLLRITVLILMYCQEEY